MNTMATRHIYHPLKWVKPEFDATIKSIHHLLKTYSEEKNSDTSLESLHEITSNLRLLRGSLEILEFYGVSLLIECMQNAVKALGNKNTPRKDDVFEALLQATLALESYIDKLHQDHHDLPLSLLPVMNDIRASINEPLLSESALFLPNLSIVPKAPNNSPASDNEACLTNSALSLRPYYQAALLTWFRDPSDQLSMQQMKLVAKNLESSSLTPRNRQIWWIMGGLYEALSDKGLNVNISLKLLLAQTDRILKSLSQDNSQYFEKSPPIDLLKNALYYVSQASSNGQRVKILKKVYNLNNVIPSVQDLSRYRKALNSPNSNSLQAIAKELQKSLDQIKATIAHFARNTPENTEALKNTIIPLKHISDTLSLLGMGNEKKILQVLLDRLNNIVNSPTPPNREAIFEVGSATLHAESAINNLGTKNLNSDSSTTQSTSEDDNASSINADNERRILTGKTAEAAKANIVEIKHKVLAHLFGGEKRQDSIAEIPALFFQIRGSMIMLNNPHLPEIMDSLNQYVENTLLTENNNTETQYDVFAEAIISLEYYLDSLIEEKEPDTNILRVTYDSLSALGYPVHLPKIEEQPDASVTHINEISKRLSATTDTAKKHTISSDAPQTKQPPEKKQNTAANNVLPFSIEENDREIKAIFSEEAFAELEKMDSSLKILKLNPGDTKTLSTIREIFHTLKGSGKIAGATLTSEIASSADDYVALVLCKSIQIEQQGVTLLSDAQTLLYQSIDDFCQKKPDKDAALVFQKRVSALITAQTLNSIKENKSETTDFQATQTNTEGDALNNVSNKEKSEEAVNDKPQENEPKLTSDEAQFAIPATEQSMETTPDEDFDLIAIFMEEAVELIEKGHGIISNTKEIDDQFLSAMQRLLHTIKGSARMAGVTSVGNIAHALESVFESIIAKKISLPDSIQALTLESLDIINDIIEDIQSGADLRPYNDLLIKLENTSKLKKTNTPSEKTQEPEITVAKSVDTDLAPESEQNKKTNTDNKATAPKDSNATDKITRKKEEPQKTKAQTKSNAHKKRNVATHKSFKKTDPIKVDPAVLDKLVDFATEESAISNRIDEHIASSKASLFELDKAIARTLTQMRDLQFESHNSRPEQKQDSEDDLNLSAFSETQKVAQRLMESIGDIEKLHGTLMRLTLESDSLVQTQKKIHNQLHETLLNTRMVTFSVQTQRMQRILRQTCNELNKKAKLSLEGTDGAIDRSMLDMIMGPLEHIIRNAIAHGIEPPRERSKLNKAKAGSVHISFSKDKAEHLIIISDDGAGLNLDNIRSKAIEKNLIDENCTYSDDEIANLIFEPGLSTNDKISQIAGRGIGMDVVLNTIHDLGGSISIATEKGKGSTFTIRLPFTLSRNHTLIIKSGNNSYALPSASVENTFSVSLDELKSFYEAESPGYTFNANKYPLWYIDALLNNAETRLPSASDQANIILIKFGQKRIALHVDKISETKDVVLKPNSPQLSDVAGIAGATVMGDGKVVLIIDIPSLTKLADSKANSKRKLLFAEDAKQNDKTITTMVVDDSITVRKVTERFLSRKGIKTLLAKDGIDALKALDKSLPDVMLLDIEMPGMDGLELAKRLKSTERLRHIPIIMITSRTGKRHRNAASEIGVDVFLGKPYQETELLSHIQNLTHKQIDEAIQTS